MLITIVQAEIETAIREYIDRQINLRPGMNVAIDLQATRGAEGFRAIIDITTMVPVKVTAVSQVQASQSGFYVSPQPSQAKEAFPPFTVTPPRSVAGIQATVPQSPAEVSALMAAEYAKEDAADIALSVAESIVEADLTKITVPAMIVETTVVETMIETADSPPSLKSPSLFKNLRKPVNA